MAYGRVKHKPRNRIGSRTIRTVTYVGRIAGVAGRANYQAYSCLARKSGGNGATWTQTCTGDAHARTPQSAIALSLKSLAGVIAKRNRVKSKRRGRSANKSYALGRKRRR